MKRRIDLKLLLPEAPDAQDACVARLIDQIRPMKGVEQVHVVEEDGQAALCLHYDPNVVTLASLERTAQQAGAEITHRYGHATFPVRLIDGEDGARRIEASMRKVPGVLGASANLPAQVVRVEWDRTVTERSKIAAALDDLRAKPAAEEEDRDHEHAATFLGLSRELLLSIVCGVLLVVAFAGGFLGLPKPVGIAIYVASYLCGGWDLASHWLRSLFKGKVSFDVDLLMLLAALGAALLGEWSEGAFLLFLFSLAHSLEHMAMDKARGAIRALSDLTPDVALVKKGGTTQPLPIAEVAVGDVVVVRPGERIPVDGKVETGRSGVNQAPVTGESVPVDKAPGDPVFAGTVNGDGTLEIITEKAIGDRTLDRVIQLVEEAQTQKAPTEVFSDRFVGILVPTVLVSEALVIAVPPLLGWLPWSESFYRGMSLLVGASPCALALGTPATVLTAIARAAREGVLFKGGAHLENLGHVRAIAFDKTGTLTVGEPSVTDVVPAAGVESSELLGTAAGVERKSQHPLAKAVAARAESDRVIEPANVGELQSVTGKGVRARVGEQEVAIGSLKLWEGDAPEEVRAAVARLASEGKSTMTVRAGDRWLGVLGLADTPREGVKTTLNELRALEVKPLVMLTGDNRGVGEAVGKSVGVDEVRAELLPEDKVVQIRDLLARYKTVAMIGDGVNDAPALANATVGIAMGGAGTAVALETADVALMGDRLDRLPFAVGLARAASAIIRQNLFIALAVIAGLVITTIGGWTKMGVAVVFHEGSTLVVLANALRLLRFSAPAVRPKR